MSVELLQRFREHLDAGNLLTGYTVKYYRWSDQDLQGAGQVARFRMPGTEGNGAHVIQRPDMELTLMCNPDQVNATDKRMLQILQYLRANFSSDTASGVIVNLWPFNGYSGPVFLENNRAQFSMVVRAVTEDH